MKYIFEVAGLWKRIMIQGNVRIFICRSITLLMKTFYGERSYYDIFGGKRKMQMTAVAHI